jgi:NAD-dependent deacetylase
MSRPAADELGEELRRASRIVVFTGAGVSTESGIPDFRSPGRRVVADEADLLPGVRWLGSEAARGVDARVFPAPPAGSARRRTLGTTPLRGLVASGKASAVITQNVDNLHQASGVPEGQVIELHGNASYATCLSCGLRHELEQLRPVFIDRGEIPVCVACGELVKTATISFGQQMPRRADGAR